MIGRRGVIAAALAVVTGLAMAQPASAGVSGVAFGSLVSANTGETFAQAVARQDAAYGSLPISRVFYPGAVQPWPGRAGASGRPVVVSFKYIPSLVLTGQYDDALYRFFAGAPTTYAVYWSYLHEPEDDIEKNAFTLTDYRAAWQHISEIAAVAAPLNANLHATLILMCFTVNPASGRDWHNYYVGPLTQSMIAFDCYNHAGKGNAYGDPANIFKPITDWQATPDATGIPWGVSETGSTVSSTDLDGSLRAAWLRRVGSFLATQHANPLHAIFGIYFDTKGPNGTDYRLIDNNSRAAWREVVQNY